MSGCKESEIFFRLASAQEGQGRLSIGLFKQGCSGPEVEKGVASFQQSIVAMWWEKLLRGKGTTEENRQVMMTVPVPSLDARTLSSLEQAKMRARTLNT